MNKLISLFLASVFIWGMVACTSAPVENSVPAESAVPVENAASAVNATTAENTAPIGETVELTLVDSFLPDLSEPDVIALNIAIEQFIANHPEITITRDQSSADVIDTKVPTLATANELPDLFACRSAWVPNFVTAGQLMSVQDLMTDDPEFAEGFMPGMLDDFTYQDKAYGIPWRSMSLFIMYYNTEKLAEAGVTAVPQTYDELMTAIKACNDAGISPISLGDLGKWQSRMWLSGLSVRTAGVDWLERLKDGSLKFTDPDMLKAISMIGELGTAQAFNPDFTSIDFLQGRQLFYDGNTAMYGEMAAFAQVENQAWPETMRNAETVVMTFFPTIDGETAGGKVNMPVAADWGIAFNSNLNGAKLEAAKLFANEVLGDDYNRILAENAGIAVRSVDGVDYSKIPEAVQRYNEDIAPNMNAGGHIDSRMPGSVLDAVSAALQDLLLGMATPEEAAERMQQALDESAS